MCKCFQGQNSMEKKQDTIKKHATIGKQQNVMEKKFNSMGGGHMNLSDYMGGRGLWKFNSMGGGVEKKVPSSPPPGIFFWNSPQQNSVQLELFK